MGQAERVPEQRPQWGETQDRMLVTRARAGDAAAMDRIIERYRGFVRLKASSYFLAGLYYEIF